MMIINTSNKLKEKVINHENLTDKEQIEFLNYMITKTKIIVDSMYKENNKDYNYMYLFYEVCFSYNLTESPTIDSNYLYLILELGDNKYLIDMNFTSDDILPLKENKFIKYTSNNYKKYLEVKKS